MKHEEDIASLMSSLNEFDFYKEEKHVQPVYYPNRKLLLKKGGATKEKPIC